MRQDEITEEVFNDLLSHVSNGKTLRSFCREINLQYSYMYNYINELDTRALRFARAREIGSEAIGEECLEIADTPQEGIETEESENGTKIKKADMLNHRKLQIYTRLQLLAKWNPKKWGDKLDLNANISEPVVIEVVRKNLNKPTKEEDEV